MISHIPSALRLLPLAIFGVLLASVSQAQQSLTTTYSHNSGGASGGAMYYTLTAGPHDVTITGIEFSVHGAGGLSGTIDIMTTPGGHVGNELNQAVWTLTATCTIASSSVAGTPSPSVMNAPFTIPAGTSIGVAHVHSFGLAPTMTTATFLPTQYSACGLTLDAGAASNVPFTGTLFVPRLPNTTIHYSVAGDCSGVESIGEGCVREFASVYEDTTLDQFAQNNTLSGIDFVRTGAGYVLQSSVGGMQPVGSLDPTVQPLPGIGDDQVVSVGTLGLFFGSNGWLSTGPGNTTQWSPSPMLFLNQSAEQFSCWSDFQPNAGGSVYYEESGTQVLLTFDQVLAWGTTDANTFQFAYDAATGDCSIHFGAMASSASHPMMIGYSPGGPSLDPGPIAIESELNTNGSIEVVGTDVQPLELAPVGNPIQLAAASDWDLTTSSIEPGAVLHVGILGIADPSLPLQVVGMPADCTLYANASVFLGPEVISGSSHTWTALTLPPVTQPFAGFELYTQAFTLDATLQLGAARASNGVKGTVGSL